MPKADRSADAAPHDRRATGPDDDLDTGHPAWVRWVTILVLAIFVLATLVSALA